MNMKRNVSTRGQSIIMENSGRQPMTAAKCALAKGKNLKKRTLAIESLNQINMYLHLSGYCE